LGYADGSSDLGTAAAPGQVLIKYTLAGDANLDGTVNLTDLLDLLNSYALSGRDWAEGDFNYDGTVNLTDLLTLLNSYGESNTSAESLDYSSESEPTVVYILVLNGDGMGNYVPGDFAVYAVDSTGNNAGIAGIGVGISGDGFSVDNVLPQGAYGNGLTGIHRIADAVGFTQYNSGYSYSVSGSTIVGGSQDTTATSGVALVDGVGQMAGSLPGSVPPGLHSLVDPTSPEFEPELLVATGTYTAGSPPTLEGGNSSANVFVSSGSSTTEAANVVLVTETLT
jgi:hypothetical protein